MAKKAGDIGTKGERTRQRVVETARALFHTRGYGNTSMDAIVRKSRVTKGNLYYYFASKEALGHAVLELTIAEQVESGAQAEGDGPDAHIAALFRRAEQALSDGRCKRGCLFGNLALEVSDLHDGLRQKLDQAFTTWERRVAALLEQGVKDGMFSRELDPRATARFVLATLEGGILLAKVTRDVGALRACATMVARVLDGYRETGR